MENNRVQWKMETRLGALYLVASARGLQAALFDKVSGVPMAKALKGSAPEVKILAQAVKELDQYFSGKRKDFDVPLDVEGTEFQRKVWSQLQKIPYGKTKSYKDVAGALRTKGVRAVGTANGRNPICIIVPCHRVIAADGGLGGYSGGLDKKEKLLAIENSKWGAQLKLL